MRGVRGVRGSEGEGGLVINLNQGCLPPYPRLPLGNPGSPWPADSPNRAVTRRNVFCRWCSNPRHGSGGRSCARRPSRLCATLVLWHPFRRRPRATNPRCRPPPAPCPLPRLLPRAGMWPPCEPCSVDSFPHSSSVSRSRPGLPAARAGTRSCRPTLGRFRTRRWRCLRTACSPRRTRPPMCPPRREGPAHAAALLMPQSR